MTSRPFDELTIQPPPELGNQYLDDWLLRAWLEHVLPRELLEAHADELEHLGKLAGDEHYRLQLADRTSEPVLTQWDAWGRRIDEIELTRVWKVAEPLAARFGLVANGYDERLGEHGRTLQYALAYLFVPSTDFYGCPLAMTDGAARILSDAGNPELAERALPRLTSRDPEKFWTSGQWMTEIVGGSDVSRSETVARRDGEGRWRLYGRKWFTSAATSQMALTLARPEGNPEGSKGLALFYLEPRDDLGRLQGIEILRLKDKLGNRKVPTAELYLDGAPATPVGRLERGVAAIAPMLNLTRTWNAVTACALMRRGLALATDYAGKRRAFGKALIDQPLHVQTLAEMNAEQAVGFCAAFGMIRELGRAEHGHPGARPELVRILTPVVKLGTGKQAVAGTSETLECFGGAGYVEDTGLPMLLRDAQVLSIWEGTTNVLSLDLLRALEAGGIEVWSQAMHQALEGAGHERLQPAVDAARGAIAEIERWLAETTDVEQLQAGARGLGLSMNATTGLAWLIELAAGCLEAGEPRPAEAARLFAASRFVQLRRPDREGSRRLVGG